MGGKGFMAGAVTVDPVKQPSGGDPTTGISTWDYMFDNPDDGGGGSGYTPPPNATPDPWWLNPVENPNPNGPTSYPQPSSQPPQTNMPPTGLQGDMSYTVPAIGSVPVPNSSGHQDPAMTPWIVTPEQTVAGQLAELYNRDSPFFETARQKAIRSHLSGGGQNSAMAAQFGELAAMDEAFKVAFQDAATYAASAQFNASMSNQFSLAEQAFIHNAVLSDQAFQQAAALQTQRIAATFESIVLDYKGRANLMDKELDQYLIKSQSDFGYQLGLIGAQTDATTRVNSMNQLANFYVTGFQSVMAAANNPNLTPEQSAAALREGMATLYQQWQFLADFLGAYGNAAGANPYDWLGNAAFDPANWASF